MEAMACRCAVIMCDYAGLGEMVTVKNFNYANVKDHNNYPAIIKHVLP